MDTFERIYIGDKIEIHPILDPKVQIEELNPNTYTPNPDEIDAFLRDFHRHNVIVITPKILAWLGLITFATFTLGTLYVQTHPDVNPFPMWTVEVDDETTAKNEQFNSPLMFDEDGKLITDTSQIPAVELMPSE